MIETRDGFQLNKYEWLAAHPLFTVALVHGYGEHGGRYEHIARVLNARRISVVAVDLRGHGLSSGDRGDIQSFDDYYIDLHALVAHAESVCEGSPIALLGHSMGGLLCVDWLLAGKGRSVAALVLSSPMFGCEAFSAWKIGLLKLTSSLRKTVSMGITGAMVSRDEVIALQYDTDPLVFKRATTQWVLEVNRAMDRVLCNASRLELPTLLLYAEHDQVVLPESTAGFAAELTVKDCQVESIPMACHEIFNEPADVRQKLIGQVARWLTAHSAQPA